jgi:ribose 5-phosphate isomerase B
MTRKPIVIGCDNAAVQLKEALIGVLKEEGYSFEDVGVEHSEDQTGYPVIAQRVADRIIASNYHKEGILICGTGIGMAITANKFPGIYAAVCHDTFSSERARLSNNTNVFCMGARIVAPELARKLLREWLGEEFKGGPSLAKVEAIHAIEKVNYAK